MIDDLAEVLARLATLPGSTGNRRWDWLPWAVMGLPLLAVAGVCVWYGMWAWAAVAGALGALGLAAAAGLFATRR